MDALAFYFGEYGGKIGKSRTPHHVMGAALADFVEVFEVEGDQPSLERLDGFERIEPRAHPMAGIRACAQPRRASFERANHGFIVPVQRGLGMVVNGHAYLVFIRKFFDEVQGDARRLGCNHFNAHGFGEIEDLTRLFLVVGQPNHAVTYHAHAGVGQFLLRPGEMFLAHVVVKLDVLGQVRAEPLAWKRLGVFQSERRDFVNGFREGEAVEAP